MAPIYLPTPLVSYHMTLQYDISDFLKSWPQPRISRLKYQAWKMLSQLEELQVPIYRKSRPQIIFGNNVVGGEGSLANHNKRAKPESEVTGNICSRCAAQVQYEVLLCGC